MNTVLTSPLTSTHSLTYSAVGFATFAGIRQAGSLSVSDDVAFSESCGAKRRDRDQNEVWIGDRCFKGLWTVCCSMVKSKVSIVFIVSTAIS